MTQAVEHVPVLLSPVLVLLSPEPGKTLVDATVGGGGHARALAERLGPSGLLVGLDRDPEALARARVHLAGVPARVVLRQANFRHLASVLAELGLEAVHGILLDLGVSSFQLDRPERGFSYREDGPLDMRMDPSLPVSAADLVARLSATELAEVFRRYGEEPHARRIAEALVAQRARQPITRTGQLYRLVQEALPPPARHRALHAAQRVFQALRIAVNDELSALEEVLPQAVDLLLPGGRMAVISFHSLEDRRVKRFFAEEAKGCVCPPGSPACACGRKPRLRILTRRPVMADLEELARNPRAASARLRAAERLTQDPA